MAFDKSYIEFGALIPEGKSLRIYRDRFKYLVLNVGASVTHAIWNGDKLIVYLGDGSARIYTDRFSYTPLRLR
jgi:hypothetical protein